MDDAESHCIQRWASLVRSRRDVIGTTEDATTGEEFTTSGELELDSRVAEILLDVVLNDLPNYGVVDRSGEVVISRPRRMLRNRRVQLLPVQLFMIDWASSGPGMSSPETYHVTFVPHLELRIVTASKDDNEIWGYSDLAIGLCRPVRDPAFGTKRIVQQWWRRAGGCEPVPWEAFLASGLIDKERAERWRDEVFGRAKPSHW
jgi:hypothetical protein